MTIKIDYKTDATLSNYYAYTIKYLRLFSFYKSFVEPDNITVEEAKEKESKDPFLKWILVVDDEPDITIFKDTFSNGFI